MATIQIQPSLQKARTLKHTKTHSKIKIKNTFDDSCQATCSSNHTATNVLQVLHYRNRESFYEQIQQEFVEKFDTAVKINDPQYLWSWLKNLINIQVEQTSNETVNIDDCSICAPMLKRHISHRTQPHDSPTISAEIKHIVKSVRKNGKEKKEYGIVFNINNNTFPVCFGSKDQTMLYICTLLRQKIGEKMYLHEFFNNSKGNSNLTRFKREHSEKWIQTVYETIFPHDVREFSEWIDKVRLGHGRPLNQGKSQSTKHIERILESEESSIYYCILNTKEDKIGDSYYEIRISPENISIPQNMQFLLDDFNDLMRISK